MAFDLAAVRGAVTDAIKASQPQLNAYGAPEAQPEYPCAVLGYAEPVTFHVAHCREGVRLDFELALMVANADLEAATTNLEALLCSTLVEDLEDFDTAAWSQLNVSEARQFQQLDDIDGLGCVLALTVHI
jgi:hypothetical protein